jgi:hypothetical protein
MDQETVRLQHLPEDLSHLYKQVMRALELDHQNLDLTTRLPGMPPLWKLDQVVENLVSNAIKLTSTGGTVKIDAGETGLYVWIRISDTGPGIPLKSQEKYSSHLCVMGMVGVFRRVWIWDSASPENLPLPMEAGLSWKAGHARDPSLLSGYHVTQECHPKVRMFFIESFRIRAWIFLCQL